jgi:hypothetical protein
MFMLVLSCFPREFAGTRLLEVIIGRLSSRKSSIKQKTCVFFRACLHRVWLLAFLVAWHFSLEPKIRCS